MTGKESALLQMMTLRVFFYKSSLGKLEGNLEIQKRLLKKHIVTELRKVSHKLVHFFYH